MLRSTKRILTTHVGSLVRPESVRDFVRQHAAGGSVDETAEEGVLRQSVADIVHRQHAIGLDIPSDGEFGKPLSWSTYALERLSGFERRAIPAGSPTPFQRGADRDRFPEFYRESEGPGQAGGGGNAWDSICVGPIEYTEAGKAQLQRDLDNLRSALEGSGVTEAFFPGAAPGSVIPDRKNEYYNSNEECLEAIAAAMAIEYRMILAAGFVLQIDDARAAVTYDRMVPPASLAEFQSWVARHVEALNRSLEGLPTDRIRYHVCWGSWPGPHSTDVPLRDIAEIVLRVNAGAYLIEAANPRHEHEWKVWRDVKLPEGKILVPGVISHATNIVEHPELVAERIVRFANVVGKENLIAGADCGFAQSPLIARVHPTIMWAKLEALVEGAALASKELWN